MVPTNFWQYNIGGCGETCGAGPCMICADNCVYTYLCGVLNTGKKPRILQKSIYLRPMGLLSPLPAWCFGMAGAQGWRLRATTSFRSIHCCKGGAD